MDLIDAEVIAAAAATIIIVTVNIVCRSVCTVNVYVFRCVQTHIEMNHVRVQVSAFAYLRSSFMNKYITVQTTACRKTTQLFTSSIVHIYCDRM